MSELLIKRAKKGDSEAFCRLMDLHMQSLYKIAWTYLKNEEDVADVIQDTICTCFEKITSLKQNRYFKTWLVRILINKCKDFLNQRKRVVCMDELPELPFQESNFEMVEWHQILDLLDEKYQTILLLYYMEEFRVKEIAEILNMKEGTVKSRLLRGRQKLLEIYRDGREVEV